MLLQRLREYSRRLDATPTMYVSTPIRWLIDLNETGALQGFVQMEGEGRRGKRGKEFLAPHVMRSSKVAAKLLADRADYALGFSGRDGSKHLRGKVAVRHEAFKAVVRECAVAIHEPAVGSVSRFLEGPNSDALDLPADLAPGDVVTFRVGDVMPIDLPAVREFWAERHRKDIKRAARDADTECLVCGRRRPPATRHPMKIKRIPRGQQSGMALVSANAPAFESYGLRASLIAPICAECAEDYVKAANGLIEDERTHLVIGSLMYLFWTRDDVPPPFVGLLTHPEPDEVKALLQAPKTGGVGATKTESISFYATALSASGGRVAVREWLETTVEEVKENIKRYFALQEIVDWDGSEGRPIGLFPLAASLVAEASDLPPQIPAVLLRLALTRTPLPQSLLAEAIRRTRAEQRVTRPRAAVIKMVLLSAHPEEDGSMERLDPDLRHAAYLCGRIFAIVEAVQRAALGDVNATVGDRYFGAASSSPAYVLGKLVSDAKKAHFGKLRRQNPAAYHALNQRLEEAMEGLGAFPATLTLEEQGRFVLGYYHQRAADRAAARARKEHRADAQEVSPESGQAESLKEED